MVMINLGGYELHPSPLEASIATIPVEDVDIDVLTVDGRTDEDHTILITEPYSGYVGRIDERARLKAIASQLSARVIAIDNIGLGIGTTHEIPQEVRDGLAECDFTPLATRQWDALLAGEDILAQGKLSIVGMSLGVPVATALAKNIPKAGAIDRMVLIEGIYRPGSLGSLGVKFASEMRDWGDYKKQNTDLFRQLQREGKFPHLGSWAYVYPQALTRPRVKEDLLAAVQARSFKDSAHLDIVNGSRSRVSPTADNMTLAREYRLSTDGTFGSPDMLHTVLQGESHGIIDDLAKYVQLLDILLVPRR